MYHGNATVANTHKAPSPISVQVAPSWLKLQVPAPQCPPSRPPPPSSILILIPPPPPPVSVFDLNCCLPLPLSMFLNSNNNPNNKQANMLVCCILTFVPTSLCTLLVCWLFVSLHIARDLCCLLSVLAYLPRAAALALAAPWFLLLTAEAPGAGASEAGFSRPDAAVPARTEPLLGWTSTCKQEVVCNVAGCKGKKTVVCQQCKKTN